jgi:two-component system chemotaxis response regulator CheY
MQEPGARGQEPGKASVGSTVLVVDDSNTMRQMVAHVLRLSGYEVLEAADAEAALELARAHRVDAVLTDHNLPGMDGLQLVRTLRGSRTYRERPIVVLTTERSEELREAHRVAGATGWMVKPFDPELLVQMLRKVLA